MNRRLAVTVRILVLLVMFASLAGISRAAWAEGQGPYYKVIASGLNNPRGMSFGPDGALYVAEAGKGGTDCVDLPPGEEDPEGGSQLCFGFTGAITRISHGHQTRIFKNLPSYADSPEGGAATGPNGVAFTLKGLRVVIGLGANPEEAAAVIPAKYKYFGYLGQMVWGKKIQPLVDIAGYEAMYNPEPTAVDSNPYAVINDGSMGIVADAGGNSLLRVDKYGNIETLAIFSPVVMTMPTDLPFPLPPEMPVEVVPNSVVKGPDGAYYVGSLGGFPFLKGASKVYRVVPGQEPTVYADGFTSTNGIAFDRMGNLYVLEMATNGLLAAEMGGDFTGALIRVNKDGTRDVVMSEGLVAPTGLTVGRDGYIYVANFGVMPGQGQILKIRPW